jgi:hypothetical protein
VFILSLHCPGICCQTELQDGRKEQTEKEKKDSEELQELLKRAEQLKTPPQPEHQRGSINAKGRACEDAIKFLYACLEDIELERIAHTPVQNLLLRYTEPNMTR